MTSLEGDQGDSVVLGGDGDDIAAGLAGVDSIDGGPGDDHLYGGDDGEEVKGRQGRDVIDGGPGTDGMDGGDGDDVCLGAESFGACESVPVPVSGIGNDGTCAGERISIVGTDGDDAIEGTTGADVIGGLGGNDQIDGLAGNDISAVVPALTPLGRVMAWIRSSGGAGPMASSPGPLPTRSPAARATMFWKVGTPTRSPTS